VKALHSIYLPRCWIERGLPQKIMGIVAMTKNGFRMMKANELVTYNTNPNESRMMKASELITYNHQSKKEVIVV